MFSSKIVLVAVWCLAGAAAEDTVACAAFPKEGESLGERAMIQTRSGKQSPVPTMPQMQEGVIAPLDSMTQLVSEDQASLPANSVDPMKQVASAEETAASAFEAKYDITGKLPSEQSAMMVSQPPMDAQMEEQMDEPSVGNQLNGLDDIISHEQPSEQSDIMVSQSPMGAQMASPSQMEGNMEEPKAESHLKGLDDIVSYDQPRTEEQSMAALPAQPAVQQESLSKPFMTCDWKCYAERYTDLQESVGLKNFAGLEQHWNAVGQKEGRDCTCATENKIETSGSVVADDSAISMSAEEASASVAAVDATTMSAKEPYDSAAAVDSGITLSANPTSDSAAAINSAMTMSASNSAATVDSGITMSANEASASAAVVDSPMIMSSEVGSDSACDFQCYLNRYPDLAFIVGANNLQAAEEHWNTAGKSEGRDCTCDAGESSMPVESGLAEQAGFAAQATSDAEANGDPQQALTESEPVVSSAGTNAVQQQASAGNEAAAVMTTCQPSTPEAQAALQAEMSKYVNSAKFQDKIAEAKGEKPASAGHVAIMKYLRDKVLEKGMSVLDLGCAAGGVLRFLEDEYTDRIGEHGDFVGVDLVSGWVEFAQGHFKNLHFFEGDITEYSLPEPFADKTFELVMLNDVMGQVQNTRYGCLLAQVDKMTHTGSLVYMHTPSPWALLDSATQSAEDPHENLLPHHYVVAGMASIGFELLTFEHDMDTICGGEGKDVPKHLKGAHCYQNGWPKYTHNVYRKVGDTSVLSLA